MSKVFAALGDEHRQRIMLLFESGERLNVGQVAACLRRVARLYRITLRPCARPASCGPKKSARKSDSGCIAPGY